MECVRQVGGSGPQDLAHTNGPVCRCGHDSGHPICTALHGGSDICYLLCRHQALYHHDCDETVDLPWEKPVLLKRYQTALERLLVMPDFINEPDMTGLQALAIYVVRIETALELILLLI